MLLWLSEFLRGSNLEALSALAIGTGLLISRLLKGFREGRREKGQLRTGDEHHDPCRSPRQSCDHEMGQICRQLAEMEMSLTRINRRLRRFQRNVAVDQRAIRMMLNQLVERLEQ